MEWLRWYHGACSDDKWPLIAKKANVPQAFVVAVWAMLLEVASQDEDRGSIEEFDPEAADALMGMPDGSSQAILDALAYGKKPRVVDGCISSWGKRQPQREREDDSAERVRKHREKKRLETKINAIETPAYECVTPCNASATPVQRQETPRAEQRREEKEEEKNPPYPPLGGAGCEGEHASSAERNAEHREPQPEHRPQPERRTRRTKGESLDDVQGAIAECAAGSVGLAAAFEDFRVMRERMRKPLTVAAIRLTGKELANLAGNDVGKKIAILNQSVQRSWQGVFAIKQDSRASPQPQQPLTAAQEKQSRMAQNAQDVLKSREALRNDPQNPYGDRIGGNVRALPSAQAG